MTTITADEIREMLTGEYAEARREYTDPERRKHYDSPDTWPLHRALVCEALFAIDPYRPSEVLTDETDESLDELAGRMADEAMEAVMETAHRIMANRVAVELGGKLYRKAARA